MTSTISIAATFSAEPIKAPMAFWGEELDLPLQIEFAPYRQIFQELLDVHSGFARNQRGLNVILLRFEDLVPGWTAGTPQTPAREHLDSLARNGHELATAIQAASLRFVVPSLVVICPASPSAQELPDLAAALHQAEIEFVTAAESLPHVEVVTPDQLLIHHAVAEYYDAAADRLGNIPYTPLFFTTLGTQIVRRLHARCRPPFKLLVLDCDQTLWNGVCGEDGPERVSLDESRRYLQHFVQAQRQAGMLLALSSKNNPADVAEVFRLHPEFPLRESDFAASQIHWEPKSQSIADLANELQLGLGSVVFLDDNPVECAEVAANCPEALVLPLPAKSADIPAFLRGIWAFDRPKATAEDRLRASFVQQDVHRDQLRQQTTTLTEFIATLNLVVQIENPALAELDRISQLTLRTNQFNTTTIRRDAAEIRRLFAEKTREFVVVRVSDRFGDYGLVGAVVFETLTTSLHVDSLLLSCRALGRGVEHRILRFLGELAQERGLEFVAVSFVATAKNEPAHLFLEQIGPSFREEAGGSVVYRFPGAALRNLNVQEIVPTAPSRTTEPPRPAPTATESKRANSAHSTTERIKRIAETLYDSQQVLRSIESKNRPQRRLNTEPVWPRNEIEQELQRIWVAVLGIHDLGVTDPFFALGGNSLQMTQIMSRVEQELGLVISFPEFFEFPTIAGQASLAVLDEDDSAEAQPTAVDSTVKQVTGPVVREDTPRQSVMTPSAGRTQTTQAGQKPVGSGAAQITCLAVPTRDRLSSLQRCLQSYLTNFRAYQRTLEILVADDSRDAAKRANTRQFLQKFGREHDIGIRYAGADEKRQFARQLAEESGIPSHVVEFALFGTPDCDNFIGANRNAILLETAGEFILTADDDTLGETRRFPAPSGKLTFSGAADPAETWIFPDAIAAERSVIREPFNLLAGHEILLGKALPELVAESGGEYATAPYGRVDSLLESVQSQRGRIAIVQSGFLGDCAWGAPFGYWGVPMGSLLLRGAAHRQLVRTPEAYQAAIASRHVVRTFTAPTISESMYFLGCSASLDNRELLPPYFPVQRGEDLLLGAVLRSCLPDRFFGYIPGLFEHSPLEIRRFWPGEMFRTASGIDVARMVIELIRSEPRPVPCQTPEQRLQGLGEYLQEISRHPAREFGHYVRQAVQQGNRRLEAEMTECLAENEYRPEYWVNDVRHYLKLVREAQERPDYHVPVDLQRGRTAEMALELARRLVYQFGELLMAWPKLVAAAQRLKLEHHALAIRVH